MPEKKRLLIVEDDYDVAEMLLAFFQSKQYEVYHADSGMNGIAAAHAHFPQVILLDVMMPDIDGYETCRRLRQLPGLEKAVIAAVSGYGNEEDKRKSKEAGFDRHLVKPIGRATLEELVRSAAGR